MASEHPGTTVQFCYLKAMSNVRSVARLGLAALALFSSVACSDAASPSLTSGASAAGSGAAASCSAKPGAIRGKSMQMLTVGGQQRSFIYYAPSSLEPHKPAPVVIVPHGYTMTADQMFEITHYSDLADQEHFIVLFPNGEPAAAGPWNVGAPDCTSTLGILPTAAGDDQGFVDAMLEFASQDTCVDRDHVFMTGFSMGGYFSNETACLRSDIRAVAPHSGGSHDLSACPSPHRPVLLMHFSADALIPYKCGTAARDRWLARNGCQADNPEVQTVKGGSCAYYKGCPSDAQVAMCTFELPAGMRSEAFAGHAWSGGSKEGAANGGSFAIPETESASSLSWNFFKKYAW